MSMFRIGQSRLTEWHLKVRGDEIGKPRVERVHLVERGSYRGFGALPLGPIRHVAQSTPAAYDRIVDFATGDKIDLHTIDAITGGADDAFSFVGSNAFSNHAGELRVVNIGGNNWTVQGDVNGDGVADFQLLLPTSDAHTIVSGDFTL